jgi:hypothetical protein
VHKSHAKDLKMQVFDHCSFAVLVCKYICCSMLQPEVMYYAGKAVSKAISLAQRYIVLSSSFFFFSTRV